MPEPLPVPPGLELHTTYADPSIHNVHTEGAWAIWYHPDFFSLEEIQETADYLVEARNFAVTNVGMPDAQNLDAGHYVNVHIHHLPIPDDPNPLDDGFPDWFGNGVGTNEFGQPFIGFPDNAGTAPLNVFHEAFHIFQYSATSPGFEYSGDSGWYIEASAEWFAGFAGPDAENRYQTAATVAGNPHTALWHGFQNPAPGDPDNWMLLSKQYSLHLLLDHLVAEKGLTSDDITDGFFLGTDLLPQEFLSNRLGKDEMADGLADFAALMTASFAQDAPMPDWVMSEEQRDFAIREREIVSGDDTTPGINNDIALALDLGTDRFSATISAPEATAPRGWAYNVIDLGLPEGLLNITQVGGNDADTQMRLVTLTSGGWQFDDVASGVAQQVSNVDQAFLVIASAPDVYSGYETFPYALEIALGLPDDFIVPIVGNNADNALTNTSDANHFDGGIGRDTLLMNNPRDSYTLTLGPETMTIKDRADGGDGTDGLQSIERLWFDGDTAEEIFDLTVFTGARALTQDQMESFVELYIAYFNRAPDAVGLNFWGSAFASGTSLQDMAMLFVDQPETRAQYAPDLGNAEFTTAVYNNVLGRVPDLEGRSFWNSVLDSGAVSKDAFILAVLDGAKAPPPADATQEFIDQQAADQKFLSDKTDIGLYFAAIKGMSDVADAADVMALFDGTQDGLDLAVAAVDRAHAFALDGETGDFLMPLIGVVDDPFLT